jgi:hypothetical protein
MKKSVVGISLLVFGLFACGKSEVESNSAAISAEEIRLPDNTKEIATTERFSRDQEKIWKQLDPTMSRTSGTYFGLKTVQYVTGKLNKHYTNSRNGAVKFSLLRVKTVSSTYREVDGERVIAREGYNSFTLASNKPTSQDGHFACYRANISVAAGPTDLSFFVYEVKILSASNSDCSN